MMNKKLLIPLLTGITLGGSHIYCRSIKDVSVTK